jgi:hypothetical protein
MGWFILLAGVALVFSPAKRAFMFWGVYIHEMGHAIASLLIGGGVRGVRLNPDGSGHTVSVEEFQMGLSGAIRGVFTRTFVLLAGYTHAGLVGFIAAVASCYGGLPTQVMLSVSAVVCVLSLVVTRGWRAVAAALATASVCAACVRWSLKPEAVLGLGASIASIDGLRSSLGLHTSRHERGDSSDPGQLAETTFIPVKVWTMFFLIWNTAAVAACAVLLTGLVKLP